MRFLWVVPLLLAPAAAAAQTKRLDVKSYDDFAKGRRIHGIRISSEYGLRPGFAAKILPLLEESSAWCAARFGGSVYVGTLSGRIYRLEDGKDPELVFETKKLLITSIVATGREVFASAIPGSAVYRMDPSGTWKELCRLPQKYVWKLFLRNGELHAACGLPGAIVRISNKGTVQVLHTAKAEHILAVQVEPQSGTLVYGTAMPGRLVRLVGSRPLVLRDFGRREVRAVVLAPDGLWVGVNRTPGSPSAIISAARGKGPDKPAEKDTQEQPDPEFSGAVWRFAKGVEEEVVKLPGTTVNVLAPMPDGVWVGVNNGGRIFEVHADGSFDLVHTFPGGQVNDLLTSESGGVVALVGNQARVGLLVPAKEEERIYRSAVYDVNGPAYWGRVEVEGRGRFELQFRSGRTADPEAGWSEWSRPAGTFPASVSAPAGRYLQFQVLLRSNDAVLREVRIYFRNQNRAPKLSGLEIQELPLTIPPQQPQTKPGLVRRQVRPHTPFLQITWKAEDPDGDHLDSRLFVKREGETIWIPLLDGEPTAGTSARWDTRTVPDGRYILKVVTSDARSNPDGQGLTGELRSRPFIVDNGKPEVRLQVRGNRLVGSARDAWSRIAGIEIQIDGAAWEALPASDGIFDSTMESFHAPLPKLSKGIHVLIVRVWDARGNAALAAIELEGR